LSGNFKDGDMAFAWLTTALLGTASFGLPADFVPSPTNCWNDSAGQMTVVPAVTTRDNLRRRRLYLDEWLNDDDPDAVVSEKRRSESSSGSAGDSEAFSSHFVARRTHCRGLFAPVSVARVYLYCVLLI
jgi:hypothetical protein